MATSKQVRQVGAGGNDGLIPIKPMPSLGRIMSAKDPRDARKWEEVDRALDEWRKSLNLSASGGGGVTIIQGPQGGSTQPGPQGAQGTQGGSGSQGFQGATGFPGTLEVRRIHVWIALRTDGIPGRGVEIDPFDGSTHEKLDSVLRSLPAYVWIHFGPGIFTTKGRAQVTIADADRWTPKDGWIIQGSGTESTTLKLVEVSGTNEFWGIIANDPLVGFVNDVVIMDLTLDCNLSGQSVPCNPAGFNVTGHNLIVKNVDIINWGCTSTVVQEAFACGGAHNGPHSGDIHGLTVENVRIFRPVTARADSGATFMAFGGAGPEQVWSDANMIRSGSTVAVSMEGGTLHGLSVGAWFRVRNADQSDYNGSFQVATVSSPTSFTYTISTTPAQPTGDIEIEHFFNPSGNGLGVVHNVNIRNCLLDGEDFTDSGTNGYTIGGTVGAIVENCRVQNVTTGAYVDTGSGISIIYKHCVMRNVTTGFNFNLGLEQWSFNTIIIEGNLIELKTTGVYGIHFGNPRTERPMGCTSFIVRDNTIRFVDNAKSGSFAAKAVEISGGIDGAFITGNTIDLSAPILIDVEPKVLTFFGARNRTTNGVIIRAYDGENSRYYLDPDILAANIGIQAILRAAA